MLSRSTDSFICTGTAMLTHAVVCTGTAIFTHALVLHRDCHVYMCCGFAQVLPCLYTLLLHRDCHVYMCYGFHRDCHVYKPLS